MTVAVAVTVALGGEEAFFTGGCDCRMPRNTAPPMMMSAGIASVQSGTPFFGGACWGACCGGHGYATGAGGYGPLAFRIHAFEG